MQNKKELSPYAYFSLLSGLITGIYYILGALLFNIVYPHKLNSTGMAVIALFLFWKSISVGIFLGYSVKKLRFNLPFSIKFAGSYFGRFYGVFIGGFLGYEFGKFPGFIICVLIFYFVGRWFGGKLSILINNQLKKWVVIKGYPGETSEQKNLSKVISTLYAVYGVAVPILFIVIIIVLKLSDFEFGYFREWAVQARIFAIGMSLITIAYPWFMRKQLSTNDMFPMSETETNTAQIGLIFSFVPAIFAVILFFVVGISLTEAVIFSSVSMIASNLWMRKQKAILTAYKS